MLTETQLIQLRKTRTVGNRVKKAIELADVTRVDLAKGTELPYSYVTDVVSNRWQTLTVENAHKFANFFGCAIEDLFPERESIAS